MSPCDFNHQSFCLISTCPSLCFSRYAWSCRRSKRSLSASLAPRRAATSSGSAAFGASSPASCARRSSSPQRRLSELLPSSPLCSQLPEPVTLLKCMPAGCRHFSVSARHSYLMFSLIFNQFLPAISDFSFQCNLSLACKLAAGTCLLVHDILV